MPDPLRGEEVVAFIVPAEGVTVSEVEFDVRRAIPHEAQHTINRLFKNRQRIAKRMV